MGSYKSSPSKPPLKTRELNGKSTRKLEQEVNRKLQKSWTVLTILKVQSMLPADAPLNEEIRAKALETQFQFE